MYFFAVFCIAHHDSLAFHTPLRHRAHKIDDARGNVHRKAWHTTKNHMRAELFIIFNLHGRAAWLLRKFSIGEHHESPLRARFRLDVLLVDGVDLCIAFVLGLYNSTITEAKDWR